MDTKTYSRHYPSNTLLSKAAHDVFSTVVLGTVSLMRMYERSVVPRYDVHRDIRGGIVNMV